MKDPGGLATKHLLYLFNITHGEGDPWAYYPKASLEPIHDPTQVEAAIRKYRERVDAGRHRRTAPPPAGPRPRDDTRVQRAQGVAQPPKPPRDRGKKEKRAADEAQERRDRETIIAAARERHRDAAVDPQALECFVFGRDVLAPRRALYNPAAAVAGGLVVFCPADDDGPLVLAGRVAAPDQLPGYERLTGSARRQLLTEYEAYREDLRAREAARVREEEIQRRRDEYDGALAHARAVLRKRIPLDPPSAPQVEPEDVDLALLWCQRDWENVHRHQLARWIDVGRDVGEFAALVGTDDRARKDGESHGEASAEESADWRLARMLSARLAEKAALAFYERYDPPQRHSLDGQPGIIDMSIRQVRDRSRFQPAYDLAYPPAPGDGPPRRMDVKNTWRSRKDDWGYEPRHTVNKLRRLDGRDVTIVGVLSRPEPLARLLSDAASVMVLGETDRTRIEALEREFALDTGTDAVSLRVTIRDTGLDADEKRSRRPSDGEDRYRLPPWVYDPAAVFQAPRTAALRRVADAFEALRELDARARAPELRVCLVAGIDPSTAEVQALSASTRALVADWRERAAKAPMTLARLYLSLLRHFWVQVHSGAGAALNRDEVRALLFARKPDRTRDLSAPLGLPDPLHTVANLLESLALLSEHEPGELRAFHRLEFGGAGVLYGWRRDSPLRWTLMFPYCGREGREGRRACRHTRLVLGREPHCAGCGHLKCDQCSFCHKDCACRDQRECRCEPVHAPSRGWLPIHPV